MSVRRPKFVLGAISILLTGAIASCSAPVDSVLNGLGEGNGDRVSVAGDAQEGIEGDSDKYGPIGSTKVAPGTLPPTGEPQPGHARLNSEGYYNYTADDFVLGDPCPIEIQSTFQDADYEIIRPENQALLALTEVDVCVALMERTGLDPSLSIEPLSLQDIQKQGRQLDVKEFEDLTYYVVALGEGTTGICKAAVDTSDGSRGLRQPWGPSSSAKDRETACTLASFRFERFIAGEIK